MDVWMLNRKILPNDLLDIFSALGNLQAQYDWVITNHSMWYGKNCPEAVCKRWQWTGLLMSGRELTSTSVRDTSGFWMARCCRRFRSGCARKT